MMPDPRRLIKFGNSSYVVSLPHLWVEKNNLKKGDLIYVSENSGNELIILPKEKIEKQEEKKAIIDVDNKTFDDIEREIFISYVDGCNFIIVKGKNLKENREKINNTLNGLIGIEIIEQSLNEIIARDFINMREVSIKSILRRVDNILRSMFKEIREDIRKEAMSDSKYKEILNIDKEVNRLYFLIWKMVRSGLNNNRLIEYFHMDNIQLMDIWWLAMQFEHIGDDLKEIAYLLIKMRLNKKEIGGLYKLYSEIENSYLGIMGAYYKNDRELTFRIAINKEDIIKKCCSFGTDLAVSRICEKLKDIRRLIHGIGRVVLLNQQYIKGMDTLRLEIFIEDKKGALQKVASFLYENDFNIIESQSKTLEKEKLAKWDVLVNKPFNKDIKRFISDLSSLDIIREVKVEGE